MMDDDDDDDDDGRWMDGVVLIRSLDGWMVPFCRFAVVSAPVAVGSLSFFFDTLSVQFFCRFGDPRRASKSLRSGLGSGKTSKNESLF